MMNKFTGVSKLPTTGLSSFVRSITLASGLAALSTGCAPDNPCESAYEKVGERLELTRNSINNLVNSCRADTSEHRRDYLKTVIANDEQVINQRCSTEIQRAAIAAGVSSEARGYQIAYCSEVIPPTSNTVIYDESKIRNVVTRIKNSLRREFIRRGNSSEQNRHNESKITDLENLAEQLLKGGSLRYNVIGTNFSNVCMQTSDILADNGVSRDNALSFSQLCHDTLANNQNVTVLAVGAGLGTLNGNGTGAVLVLSSEGAGVAGGFRIGETTVLGGAGVGGGRF